MDKEKNKDKENEKTIIKSIKKALDSGNALKRSPSSQENKIKSTNKEESEKEDK